MSCESDAEKKIPQPREVLLSVRVYELAKQLDVESKAVLARLNEHGEAVRSASSLVSDAAAKRVRESFGAPDPERLGSSTAPLGWGAGAVRKPTHPEVNANIALLERAFPASRGHRESLAALGSQIVYAARCKVSGADDCKIALVRFSGAIEAAFGFTREVCFFYSPYAELQIRTFKAAKESLSHIPREVTPDMLFIWSPDPRLREKLDDWSSSNFLAVPLTADVGDDSIALISLIRDYIFSRDLFYETTPVRGDRFFGRQRLLQSLRDDVRNHRVSGLFGLRKSGKTSVLSQLSLSIAGPSTIVVLRDLESLPSPPTDPVPDLIRDLREDLALRLAETDQPEGGIASAGGDIDPTSFKREMQTTLRSLATRGINLVLLLDEIEYLTPADRIDIAEGDLPSVAQFLGALRSLVQENPNFTFMLSGLASGIVESGRLYGRPNPLFSWAKSNFLAPFERREADDLALSVGRKMGIGIDEGALEAFYDASGGHAFLYRHLASHVVRGLPLDSFHRRITRANVLASLEGWRLLVAGNLKEMLDHVKRYYPDEAFLLDVLREEPELFASMARDAPLALGHLLSLGLVKQNGREYELSTVLELL